jgi:catechol 2,3-dioxygenase-like lactoylglutathione lyase family enzyme
MPLLNAIGIVVSDMAGSIRFYRLLGLDVPETPDEGHIDTFLPNGIRFMLDTEDVVRSFRLDWTRETGNQLGLAFECESPAQVDEVYRRVTAAGWREGALGRVLGTAVCPAPGPRRRARGPLRRALIERASGSNRAGVAELGRHAARVMLSSL